MSSPLQDFQDPLLSGCAAVPSVGLLPTPRAPPHPASGGEMQGMKVPLDGRRLVAASLNNNSDDKQATLSETRGLKSWSCYAAAPKDFAFLAPQEHRNDRVGVYLPGGANLEE